MGEYVKRERYLQRLVERRDNRDVKIITGPRRSGKSFLLKTIYRDYLVSQSVPQENIIIVSLDLDIFFTQHSDKISIGKLSLSLVCNEYNDEG